MKSKSLAKRRKNKDGASCVGVKLSKRYIVFENRNLDFTYNELKKFHKLYDEGLDIPAIARKMQRRKVEVLLLYIDQVEKEVIDVNFKLVRWN